MKRLLKQTVECSSDNKMNATEVVVWMHDNFPDWEFYDERELNDGRIMLKFEHGPKHQIADLEEALESVGLIGVFRNYLNIIAPEDPEYAIEEEVQSSSEIYESLTEGKY